MKIATVQLTGKQIVLGLLLALAGIIGQSGTASAAACVPPATDFGSATATVSVPVGGTFRVWSRIKAPDTTNNSYLLEIDGQTCYVVGDSAITAGSWTWVDYRDGAATSKIEAALSTGNHSLKLIGREAGVQLDRIIFTADLSCVPTGSGDNCASPADTVAPTVTLTSPTANSTISGSTSMTANASDDTAVTKVEYYVDGLLKGSSTTLPYSYSLDTSALSNASHMLNAKAYDAAGNSAMSPGVSVTVNNTAGSNTTAERRTASSADDGEELVSTGAVTLTSTDLELTTDVSDQVVGMRFPNMTIPRGATITNAYLQFTTDETSSGTTTLNLYGEAADNAAAFTTVTRNISSRAKTGASVPWAPAAWSVLDEAGTNQRTPNLSGLVSAIVNRPGWNSGNALAILVTGTGSRTARAYDISPAQAPLLHVEYSTNTTPPPPPPPGDTTPPSVSINSPINGATVAGTANISVSASDNAGITKVEFSVDGVVTATKTAAPYDFAWNSATVPNGNHVIDAKAYDAAGNTALASVTLNAQNADIIAPSSPTNLTSTATAYNRVNLAWTAATDNIGVTGYWIIRNGTTIAQTGTVTSYSDTTVQAATTYNYQIVAYDAAGNNSTASSTSSASTPQAPDGQAPTVPQNLAVTSVSQTQVNLAWTAATDNIGVTGYDVYRNQTKVATVTSLSFGDSNLSASTSYTYYVVARDAAGNLSSQSNTVTAITASPPPVVNGSISGTVRDNQGRAVSGARVSVQVNNVTVSATTSSTGGYTLSNIPPKAYVVTYSATRFKTQTQNVTVGPGTNSVMNVTLSPGNGK